MRLLYIKLDNYRGIYNGMGLQSIEVDFSKCTHKILIIKGDNGSGKSTIYRAINPLNDSTGEFITGQDGKKEIKYLLDDNSVLSIRYLTQAYYDRGTDRWGYKPAKASVHRQFPGQEPVELNPSGNVTSAKDILYNLFKLDDNFLVLSALSATNKGIGMQRPAERKRYVNTIIDSLSEFIDMNKFLSKKGTVLKSLMNSLTTKLSQIGNIELVQEQVNQDVKTLSEMELQKTALTEKLAGMKVQLDEINKEGNVAELYSKEVQKLAEIKKDFEALDTSVVYSEEELLNAEKDLTKITTTLEIFQGQLKDLVHEEQNIRNDITATEATFQGYDSTQLDADKAKYDKICQELETYDAMFKKAGFETYDDLTENEYKQAVSVIHEINQKIYLLHDIFDMDTINKIDLSKKISPENYERIIGACSLKLQDRENQLSMNDQLIEQARDFENVPKDCNHLHDCPFISSIMKAKTKLLSDEKVKALKAEINELKKFIAEYMKLKESQQEELECEEAVYAIYQLIQTNSYILKKFLGKHGEWIGDAKATKHIIYTVEEVGAFSMDEYREYENYITIINHLKIDKEVVKQAIDQAERVSKDSRVYQQTYSRLQKNLERVLDSKQKMMKEIQSLDARKQELERVITSLHTAKANQTLSEQLAKDLGVSTKRVDELRNKVNLNLTMGREYQEKRQEFNQLTMNDMPILSNRLEKAKYQLVLFDQYKSDYDKYQSMNTNLQTLLYHSSPKGIQTIYIEAFMNSMLQLTNQLLQLLFSGRFMITEFKVRENEFSIPCIDNNGNPREDIAEMSDSQLSMISMIISFVMLHSASEYYNIIKLDEVDGNLDNTNRLQFAVLINKIIDILHFHQCIIISHNNEIDLSQADIMVFRMEKREELQNILSSGGNVIFNYNQ